MIHRAYIIDDDVRMETNANEKNRKDLEIQIGVCLDNSGQNLA